jgi:vanillin dehydrogenase
MSTDRIIIHKSLVEALIPGYVERVRALGAGDPADPTTLVGPLINARGAQRVSPLVESRGGGPRSRQLVCGAAGQAGPRERSWALAAEA